MRRTATTSPSGQTRKVLSLTPALVFGLLAATLWGTTDFLIRVASRRVGVFRAMLCAQAMSAVLVGLWIAGDPLVRTTFRQASVSGWEAALSAAVVGLTATVALYLALHKGRVSVVAPVAAGYGAVTTVFSWLTGERLTGVALLGLGLLVGGVVLVSSPPGGHKGASSATEFHPNTSGLGWALLSCLCYGLEFWIQGRFANPQLGPLLPVGVYYLLSTTVLVIVGSVFRLPVRMSGRDAILAFSTGALAIAGFISLSFGFQTGRVAVVTAIGSVQSAITVGLACLLMGDRLAIDHWVGLTAVVAGLVLVRLG